MAIFIPKMKRHSEPEFCFCFFPPLFFIFKFDFLVVNVDVVDVNVVGEDVVAVIVICLFAYFSSGFVLFFFNLNGRTSPTILLILLYSESGSFFTLVRSASLSLTHIHTHACTPAACILTEHTYNLNNNRTVFNCVTCYFF